MSDLELRIELAPNIISGKEKYERMQATAILEEYIELRGLVEKYQNALIEVLQLDMSVFNSAIELGWYDFPKIPNNTFDWEGHAFLWRFHRATSEQRAMAFLGAVK